MRREVRIQPDGTDRIYIDGDLVGTVVAVEGTDPALLGRPGTEWRISLPSGRTLSQRPTRGEAIAVLTKGY